MAPNPKEVRIWAHWMRTWDTPVPVLATGLRTEEGLSCLVRLGRVGFILGLKAPIPQEIQFRTKSRNVTPRCWTEICCGLGSQALQGSQGWVGRRHWREPWCGGLATCPNQRCPKSPRTQSASWAAEGGGDLLPGCSASQAPRGSAPALLFCQRSAGSVGDSGLGFRRLWGFGWVSCGLGFLGSRAHSPKAAEPGLVEL